MRLGAPILEAVTTPEAWVAAVRQRAYRAAYCPVPPEAPEEVVAAYEQAAREADLVIAEVGAWSNPISSDPAIRSAALAQCKAALSLADRIGARCCVNIAGSRGKGWASPHPRNFDSDTFDRIVESVREILDSVRPRRTFYCLETMPWIFPDSAGSYLDLISAIDRPRFGVHFDPVNLITSPRRLGASAELVRDFVARLGPSIRSCHAKDILLADRLTVHLDEVRPGLGQLDYRALLASLAQLDPDLPVMLEHLPDELSYRHAAVHLRTVAAELGVRL